MKSTKLSLVATIAILGMFSGVNASDFDEAFKMVKLVEM